MPSSVLGAAASRAGGPITFSIIMPAFNERVEIARALESVDRQTTPVLEAIVVDDASVDGTPDYVEGLGVPWVKVIRQPKNRGAAAARNAGISASHGDVVVFLDADDMLPENFIERLERVYRAGADCVQVESAVDDQSNAIGRYLEADHRTHRTRTPEATGWTAAFSCRREIALAVGFPEELPGCGGEDGLFFVRIKARGHSSTAAFDLVVRRIVPTDLGGFIRQGMARGRPVPYLDHMMAGNTLQRTTILRAAALGLTLCRTLAVFPALAAARRFAAHSSRGWRDVPAFFVLHHVRTLARSAGEWSSVAALWRARYGQSSTT